MSKRFDAAAILVVIGAACAPPPAPPQHLSAADVVAIRAEFDTTVAAFRSGKFEPWAAIWAPDGILYPPNGKEVPASLLLAWAKAFPPTEAFSFSNVTVAGEGNVAWGTSGYVLQLKDMPVDSGRQLVVFHKQADGKWLVARGMFNSAIPLPAAAAAKPAAKK